MKFQVYSQCYDTEFCTITPLFALAVVGNGGDVVPPLRLMTCINDVKTLKRLRCVCDLPNFFKQDITLKSKIFITIQQQI